MEQYVNRLVEHLDNVHNKVSKPYSEKEKQKVIKRYKRMNINVDVYYCQTLKSNIIRFNEFYLNYTPHTINLNSGEEYESKGVARVSSNHTEIIDNECKVVYGEVEGLPEPREGVKYIVSLLVLQASNRTDLVAPASGHPDTVRNEKGHIVSVPCFITK